MADSTGKASGGSGGRKSSSGRSRGGGSRSKASGSGGPSGGSSSGARSTPSRTGGTNRSTAQRSEAALKAGKARGRQQTARKRADQAASAAPEVAEPLDFSSKNVADLRAALRRSIITPLNLIMLTRERVEEVLDDSVKRGRMTSDDAQSVVKSLVTRGRQQTDDVLANLETLLGRALEEVESLADDARKRGSDVVTGAASRAMKTADPVIAQSDRARRAAGIGPNFPVLGYDDLTAAQVQDRLDGLSAPELRKVRDHEKRNANRKTVLEAIERKLRAAG